MWLWVSSPEGVRVDMIVGMIVRELTLPLAKLAWAVLESCPWWCRYRRAGGLTYSDTTQA